MSVLEVIIAPPVIGAFKSNNSWSIADPLSPSAVGVVFHAAEDEGINVSSFSCK